MSEIGVNENVLNEIVNVFESYSNIEKAILFGSRAKGGFSLYSDIDIAICGDVSALEIEEIKCQLDELPFVYVFDVMDYEAIKNPMLRGHIDRVGVVVYETGK